MCADAGRAEGGGGIKPPFVVGDGSLALGGVGGIEAVPSIERDVDDCGFCGVERGARSSRYFGSSERK